jgi:hypothetical protein
MRRRCGAARLVPVPRTGPCAAEQRVAASTRLRRGCASHAPTASVPRIGAFACSPPQRASRCRCCRALRAVQLIGSVPHAAAAVALCASCSWSAGAACAVRVCRRLFRRRGVALALSGRRVCELPLPPPAPLERRRRCWAARLVPVPRTGTCAAEQRVAASARPRRGCASRGPTASVLRISAFACAPPQRASKCRCRRALRFCSWSACAVRRPCRRRPRGRGVTLALSGRRVCDLSPPPTAPLESGAAAGLLVLRAGASHWTVRP